MGKSFRLGIILMGVSLLIVAVFWLRNCTKDDYLNIGADGTIDPTPVLRNSQTPYARAFSLTMSCHASTTAPCA